MTKHAIEARVHRYVASSAGIHLTFLIHPDDSAGLSNIRVGATVMLAFEETVNTAVEKIELPDNRAANGGDAQASPRERPKRAFSDMSLSQQSGIRANDWRFQDFLEHEYTGVWRNLKDAAASIREICGVQSRSELATDHNAANKWRTLNSKFETWLVDYLYSESIRR